MNELNDYRDHRWYFQQAQQSADEALRDDDDTEARKLRKVALGVLMLPFMDVAQVNNLAMNRLIAVGGLEDTNLLSIKQTARKINDLQPDNDSALFARWKNKAHDETPDRFEVAAGDLRVGMTHEAGEGYHQIGIDLFARFALASSLRTHSNAPLSLFGVRFVAHPDEIRSDIITPPPSHLAVAPITTLDQAIVKTNSEFNNQGINWQRIYHSKQMHALR